MGKKELINDFSKSWKYLPATLVWLGAIFGCGLIIGQRAGWQEAGSACCPNGAPELPDNPYQLSTLYLLFGIGIAAGLPFCIGLIHALRSATTNLQEQDSDNKKENNSKLNFANGFFKTMKYTFLPAITMGAAASIGNDVGNNIGNKQVINECLSHCSTTSSTFSPDFFCGVPADCNSYMPFNKSNLLLILHGLLYSALTFGVDLTLSVLVGLICSITKTRKPDTHHYSAATTTEHKDDKKEVEEPLLPLTK